MNVSDGERPSKKPEKGAEAKGGKDGRVNWEILLKLFGDLIVMIEAVELVWFGTQEHKDLTRRPPLDHKCHYLEIKVLVCLGPRPHPRQLILLSFVLVLIRPVVRASKGPRGRGRFFGYG